MYSQQEIQKGKTIIKLTLIVLISITIIITSIAFTIPVYRVWKAKQSGKAKVVEAISEAKAMSIISSRLTKEYIYYQWVQNMSKMDAKKVIVPTDNNLPLMEWEVNDRQYYRQSD